MGNRRVHSSLDKLPADLRDAITRMVVDNEWPVDCKAIHQGNPRYEDIAAYCAQKEHIVSESAIGRFAMQMRTLSRMKQAGLITRQVMADISDENASQAQKAVAEMITAVAIEFLADRDSDSFGSKEIRDVATAMRDCASIAITSDKYVREQITKKVTAATESTKAKLTKAGVNRKLIQEIIDEHLGVVKS
jgi:hypothetical protein